MHIHMHVHTHTHTHEHIHTHKHTHTHTQSFKTQKYFHLYTIKAVVTRHLNLNYFAFNFWHYNI